MKSYVLQKQITANGLNATGVPAMPERMWRFPNPLGNLTET